MSVWGPPAPLKLTFERGQSRYGTDSVLAKWVGLRHEVRPVIEWLEKNHFGYTLLVYGTFDTTGYPYETLTAVMGNWSDDYSEWDHVKFIQKAWA